MRQYDTDGFIAVVIPFFSEVYLEEQYDLVDWVVDYRLHYVNATNGKTPRYYCVRLSHNGRDMHQVRARRLRGHACPSTATRGMHTPQEYDKDRGMHVTRTEACCARSACKQVCDPTTNRRAHHGAISSSPQVCDPTTNRRDGSGRMTGVVRAAVENMWNDLKRGHYLDSRSRVLTITLQYAFPQSAS